MVNALKSQRSTPVYVPFDLDVWRFVTNGKGRAAEHRGHFLYEKEELARLKFLPEDWWYYLNSNGEGIAIDFPIKAKPVLSWSPQRYIKKDNKLVKGSRLPLEKVCITIVKRACNTDNIFL